MESLTRRNRIDISTCVGALTNPGIQLEEQASVADDAHTVVPAQLPDSSLPNRALTGDTTSRSIGNGRKIDPLSDNMSSLTAPALTDDRYYCDETQNRPDPLSAKVGEM